MSEENFEIKLDDPFLKENAEAIADCFMRVIFGDSYIPQENYRNKRNDTYK